MTETLNEKALEAAYDLPWALEEFTRNGQRCANIVSSDGTIVCEIQGILDSCGNRENGELIVSAVNGLGARSCLPAGDYAGLVERARAKAEVLRSRGKNNTLHDIEQSADYMDEQATAITALVADRDGWRQTATEYAGEIHALRRRAEAAEAQVKAMGEAAEGEKRKAFNTGYVIACCNTSNLHNEPTIAADVLVQLSVTEAEVKNMNLSDYDTKALKEMERSRSQSPYAARRARAVKGGENG